MVYYPNKATQSRVKVPREPASFMDAKSGPGRRVWGNCVGIRGKYDASVKTLRILRINLV